MKRIIRSDRCLSPTAGFNLIEGTGSQSTGAAGPRTADLHIGVRQQLTFSQKEPSNVGENAAPRSSSLRSAMRKTPARTIGTHLLPIPWVLIQRLEKHILLSDHVTNNNGAECWPHKPPPGVTMHLPGERRKVCRAARTGRFYGM